MKGSELSHLAQLQELLTGMERDLGLDVFSRDERKVLYALTSITSDDTMQAHSSELMEHKLCKNLSKPTFYRCLRRLVDRGVIVRSGSSKNGSYSLGKPAQPPQSFRFS